MTWTPERLEKMRELFEQGITSREIAKELGITRNAVCGRLFRMGLQRQDKPKAKVVPIMTDEQHDAHLETAARSCREGGSSLAEIGNWIGRTKDWVKWHTRDAAAAQRRNLARKLATERKNSGKMIAWIPARHLTSKPCTLFQLREWSCRYPIGDPSDSSFRFCGARRREPSSYCAQHHKLTHGSGTYGERRATSAP